jgi:hypothetical protein
MSESAPAPIYVPVVEIGDAGRDFSWGSNVSEMGRVVSTTFAIRAGAASVSTGLTELPVVGDWHVTEVEASFGITLATEAGVILSKASAEATFDVTMTFSRKTDTGG